MSAVLDKPKLTFAKQVVKKPEPWEGTKETEEFMVSSKSDGDICGSGCTYCTYCQSETCQTSYCC